MACDQCLQGISSPPAGPPDRQMGPLVGQGLPLTAEAQRWIATVDQGLDFLVREGYLLVGPAFATLPTRGEGKNWTDRGSRLDRMKAMLLNLKSVEPLHRSRSAAAEGSWASPARQRGPVPAAQRSDESAGQSMGESEADEVEALSLEVASEVAQSGKVAGTPSSKMRTGIHLGRVFLFGAVRRMSGSQFRNQALMLKSNGVSLGLRYLDHNMLDLFLHVCARVLCRSLGQRMAEPLPALGGIASDFAVAVDHVTPPNGTRRPADLHRTYPQRGHNTRASSTHGTGSTAAAAFRCRATTGIWLQWWASRRETASTSATACTAGTQAPF